MIKGKRNGKAALLLSAALAATGCSTGWQAVREDWTPIKTTPDVLISEKAGSEKIREFDIQAENFKGNYFAKIGEKVGKEIFSEDSFGDNVQYKKMIYEENKTATPIFTSFGAAGGMLLGTMLLKNDYLDDEEKATNFIGLGLLGLVVGFGLDQFSAEVNPKNRTRETGELKTELKNLRTERITLNKSIEEFPASEIKVQLDGANYITDLNGRVNLSDIVESRSPNYFCRESNFSGKGMENRIKSIPLVREIKPQTLEGLMSNLISEIDPIEVNIIAETKETARYNESVKNDAKRITLSGLELSNEDVYKVVKKFVDANINSKIVQVRFDVKDLVSRTPISNSILSYDIEGARREDLAGKYFSGTLQDYAEECINDYLEYDGQFRVDSSITLPLYNPSRMHVEFTNPDYRFVEGDVFVNKAGMKKTVYMADKGSKVRIEESKDGNGKIE